MKKSLAALLGVVVLASVAPATAFAATGLLAIEHTAYTPGAAGGTNDRDGTYAGNVDCDAGTLDADITGGNAYGPYPGTFSDSVSATFAGGWLTSLVLDFHIDSGATTIDGTATWDGDPVPWGCVTTDYGDGSGVIKIGSGSVTHLDYVATIDGPSGTLSDSGTLHGWAGLSCEYDEVGGPLYCGDEGFSFDFDEPVPDYASADAVPGLTVATGFGEATASDPMITLFRARVAGPVIITEGPVGAPPTGYEFIGQTATMSGPLSSDPDDPTVVDFRLDPSALPPGSDESALLLFGDGAPISDCDYDAAVLAVPCVGRRSAFADGEAQIRLFADDATGVWNVAVVATDPDQASGDPSPGGTIATGSGTATPDDPTTTAVTTPTGGPITISEAPGGTPPAGYAFVGQAITITAPDATASDPLRIVFRLDASAIPDGYDASTVELFRNGVLVPECDSPGSGQAIPTPCVDDRATLGDGDIQITAVTVAASLWDLAVALAPPTATAIATAVDGLPDGAFKAGGHRTAMSARLAGIQASMDTGKADQAIHHLANLRRQVDGCGAKADMDDWIVDCEAQLEIRVLLDDLIADLGG